MSNLPNAAPIWSDTINAKHYWRTELISVQQKAALKCVRADLTVSTEAICVQAGVPLIKIVVDECKRVYSEMDFYLTEVMSSHGMFNAYLFCIRLSWEDHHEHKTTHVKPRGPNESKRKLLANVTISVLLYGAPIWSDTINAKQPWRTEMVSAQYKAALNVSVLIALSSQRPFVCRQVYLWSR